MYLQHAAKSQDKETVNPCRSTEQRHADALAADSDDNGHFNRWFGWRIGRI